MQGRGPMVIWLLMVINKGLAAVYPFWTSWKNEEIKFAVHEMPLLGVFLQLYALMKYEIRKIHSKTCTFENSAQVNCLLLIKFYWVGIISEF